MDPTLRIIAILSMVFDAGWKVWTETTKNMTPSQLDAFIADKENSIATIKAELDTKYGTP